MVNEEHRYSRRPTGVSIAPRETDPEPGSSWSGVSSTTTGSRKGRSDAIEWRLRSTASFHSSRKYPSPRVCVFFEITGMKSAQLLI